MLVRSSTDDRSMACRSWSESAGQEGDESKRGKRPVWVQPKEEALPAPPGPLVAVRGPALFVLIRGRPWPPRCVAALQKYLPALVAAVATVRSTRRSRLNVSLFECHLSSVRFWDSQSYRRVRTPSLQINRWRTELCERSCTGSLAPYELADATTAMELSSLHLITPIQI